MDSTNENIPVNLSLPKVLPVEESMIFLKNNTITTNISCNSMMNQVNNTFPRIESVSPVPSIFTKKKSTKQFRVHNLPDDTQTEVFMVRKFIFENLRYIWQQKKILKRTITELAMKKQIDNDIELNSKDKLYIATAKNWIFIQQNQINDDKAAIIADRQEIQRQFNIIKQNNIYIENEFAQLQLTKQQKCKCNQLI